MSGEELKQAAVETIKAVRKICNDNQRCVTCILDGLCGMRAPWGLSDEEVDELACDIAAYKKRPTKKKED